MDGLSRRLAGGLAVTACMWALLTVVPSAAQAQADPEPTFQESTGFLWGIGTMEATGLLGLLPMAVGDVCEGWGCIGYTMLVVIAAAVLGLTAGIIGAATDAPADVPFVVHHTLFDGLLGFMTAYGLTGVLQEQESARVPAGLVTAIVAAVGAFSYTFVRRDALLRDPDARVGAHIMTWVPYSLVAVVAMVLSEAHADESVSMLTAGLVGIAALAVGIAIAEVNVAADDAMPAPAPLLGWTGSF